MNIISENHAYIIVVNQFSSVILSVWYKEMALFTIKKTRSE